MDDFNTRQLKLEFWVWLVFIFRFETKGHQRPANTTSSTHAPVDKHTTRSTRLWESFTNVNSTSEKLCDLIVPLIFWGKLQERFSDETINDLTLAHTVKLRLCVEQMEQFPMLIRLLSWEVQQRLLEQAEGGWRNVLLWKM